METVDRRFGRFGVLFRTASGERKNDRERQDGGEWQTFHMVGGVVSTATSMSSRRCLDGSREDAGGFVFVEHLNVPEVIGANISCYHGVTRFGMRLPLIRV